MGDMLFGLMTIGSIAGSLNSNSASNVNSACDEFDKINKKLNDEIAAWKGILLTGDYIKIKNQMLSMNLLQSSENYKAALQLVKNEFKKQENITMISIAMFIFTILVMFLFRYFDVYGQIWRLFTK